MMDFLTNLNICLFRRQNIKTDEFRKMRAFLQPESRCELEEKFSIIFIHSKTPVRLGVRDIRRPCPFYLSELDTVTYYLPYMKFASILLVPVAIPFGAGNRLRWNVGLSCMDIFQLQNLWKLYFPIPSRPPTPTPR